MFKKKQNDVYWNHSDTPLFITRRWKVADKVGFSETDYYIPYGGGIDLSILGLKKEKPKAKK